MIYRQGLKLNDKSRLKNLQNRRALNWQAIVSLIFDLNNYFSSWDNLTHRSVIKPELIVKLQSLYFAHQSNKGNNVLLLPTYIEY